MLMLPVLMAASMPAMASAASVHPANMDEGPCTSGTTTWVDAGGVCFGFQGYKYPNLTDVTFFCTGNNYVDVQWEQNGVISPLVEYDPGTSFNPGGVTLYYIKIVTWKGSDACY